MGKKSIFKFFILYIILSTELCSNEYFQKLDLSTGKIYNELSSFKDQKIEELLNLIGYDYKYFRFYYLPDLSPGLVLYYDFDDSLFIRVRIETKDYENYTPGFDDINAIKDEEIVDVYYYLEKIDRQMHERLKEANYCNRQEMESKFYPLEDGYSPKLRVNKKLRSVKKFEARYVNLLKEFENLTFSQVLDKIGDDYYGFMVYPKKVEKDSSDNYDIIDLRYPYKDSLEISVELYLTQSFKYKNPYDIKNAMNLKVKKIKNFLLPVNKLNDFIRIRNYKE